MAVLKDSNNSSLSEQERLHYFSLACQLHNTDLPILDRLSPLDRKIVLDMYLEVLLQGERELIGRYYGQNNDFNIYGEHFWGKMDLKVVYILDRKPYFPFAEVLSKIRPEQKELNILEIGGGDGSNMIRTVENLSSMGYQVSATLTGLNDLPQHDDLREKGIAVRTKTVAESLPDSWTENFDLVISSCCMPWTNLHYSLKEVQRVLAPNGAWMNLESHNSHRGDSSRKYMFGPISRPLDSRTLPQIIQMMKVHGMEPDEELEKSFYCDANWDKEDHKPLFNGIAYIKPE